MRVSSSGAFERRAAEGIARAIELDIIGRDLAAGTFIGSEAELMERYTASRGVIREAVTLVESHMLAETRRGVGGGLVVAEPAPDVVEGIVSLLLARSKATEAELLDVRLPLEVMAMRTAVELLDERGVALLEAEMAHQLDAGEDLTHASHRLHNLLADVSGNTVLRLFIPTLCALVGELWDIPHGRLSSDARSTVWAWVSATHNEIIAAMLDRDVDRSVALLERHLEQVSAALGPETRLVQVTPH